MPMAEVAGDDVPMHGDTEVRIQLNWPAYVYPLFQAASTSNRQQRVNRGSRPPRGGIVGTFQRRRGRQSLRVPLTAAEITRFSPQNRMISWLYTKLMNSNNMADQGAMLILTSVELATRLQIPAKRLGVPACWHC